VLIYQHFPREERQAFIDRLATELARHAPGAGVIPIRTANVLFLLAYQRHHGDRATSAVESLTAAWRGVVWT
jgi:hypothetical protein